MPRTQKSGSSSSNGQIKFYKLFTQLVEQKRQVDNNLLKMEKKLLRMLGKQQQQQMGVRKVYVKRMHNKDTLAVSIRECMTPLVEMSMQDVLAALHATGLYKTRSQYFYTMVNNKLNRDPKVVKPKGKRGVFVYDPDGVYGKKKRVSKKTRSKSSSRTTSISASKTRKKGQHSVVAA
jgi:hypothetical protein